MENKVEHNIPPMMVVIIKIQQVNKVNVMQTSESWIKHNCQPILLPGKQLWSTFGQNTYHHYKLTTNHCSFYR
jgi:RNase P subunit RPR2